MTGNEFRELYLLAHCGVEKEMIWELLDTLLKQLLEYMCKEDVRLLGTQVTYL